MTGPAPINENYDREKVSQRNRDLFKRPERRHPLSVELIGVSAPTPYAYRVSDLEGILPADLWQKAVLWPLQYPVEVSKNYKPSAQRLGARIRREICREARERGIDDARLIQAEMKEDEAYYAFTQLARHYRKKGIIE